MSQLKLHGDYTRKEVHDIFAPNTPFHPQSGTWGILGIIEIPEQLGDFVLFVTFGKKEADHEFDEGISSAGILRWQSQPRQTLEDPVIMRLIAHDEQQNSVYLFLRPEGRRGGEAVKYTYMGRLKYIQHDDKSEKPVHVDWQLLDWPIPTQVLDRMPLRLEQV